MEKMITLSQREIPKEWYNVQADLPNPLKPPLNPATGEPVRPEDLEPIFPPPLIEQEVSRERWIKIPEEVLKIYSMWRPTPLYRAERLERYLDTPARIYFKYEGASPPGSHKPNTAVAQAYFNKVSGVKRLTTETGAGQWGSALSFATAMFGLGCRVYMVKVSYQQKPYRKIMMNLWGAECIPSPSDRTEIGRKILEEDPDSPGSLGIAISEAIEDAVKSGGEAKYALGSVLNHVLLHQTIIGLEAKKQMELVGEYPDIIVGCAGGGSNFSGLAFPFVKDKIEGKRDPLIIAVEPESCPTMTRGPYSYDFGDTGKMTPLLPMHTLGHDFVPPPLHAGGLRYHGMAPLVSRLVVDGFIEPRAVNQMKTFEAGVTWARVEGFIPAPETDHALAVVIEEALRAKKEKVERVILVNFSGHGLMDLSAYDAYLEGKLRDYKLPEEEIERALRAIRDLPKP